MLPTEKLSVVSHNVAYTVQLSQCCPKLKTSRRTRKD